MYIEDDIHYPTSNPRPLHRSNSRPTFDPPRFTDISKIDGPLERHIEQLWDEINKLKDEIRRLKCTNATSADN